MRRKRREFGADQKAAIVRRHLSGKQESVSDLAEEFQVQPSQIHTWVKTVLDQAEKAFDRDRSGRRRQAEESRKDQAIAQLQEKIVSKNAVIAELMEENVRSKKAPGEP